MFRNPWVFPPLKTPTRRLHDAGHDSWFVMRSLRVARPRSLIGFRWRSFVITSRTPQAIDLSYLLLLIIVSPCRINGAGEERASERPVPSLGQLYALVDLMPDRWKAFLLLKTFASLRWGEITPLTRDDLNLARRTVRVRRQFLTVPGGLQTGPPKSRAGIGMVSFPAGILPELQHHLDTYSADGGDGLVFVNEHGEPLRRGNFNPAVGWRQACEQIAYPTSTCTICGIPATPWRHSTVPVCATS